MAGNRLLRVLAASAAVSAAATGFLVTTPALTPAAFASGCGSSNLYLDGTPLNSINAYYAQANITTRVPTVCGSPQTEDAAWVVIQEHNQNGFAQAGYYETNNSNADLLFAAEESNGLLTYEEHDFNVAAPSGAPLYSITYDFNGGYMICSTDNGNYIYDTTFDPATKWTGTWDPTWAGETHMSGDNVPGTSSSPAYFSNLLITVTRGGGTITPTGLSLSVSPPNSRYSNAWDTSNSKFHIWTN